MIKDDTDNVVLWVENLNKTFGGGGFFSSAQEVQALKQVNLSLNRGETLAIVGESGSGKSTLARVLMTLEQPTSGAVIVNGVDPFSLRGKALNHWRKNIQMVFQDPYGSLNPKMTVGDIVAEPWLASEDIQLSKPEMKDKAIELLKLVGLRSEDMQKITAQLSGGQRQRVGIARALALQPQIIICDEPVSALDLSVQAQVLNLLASIQAKTSVSYIFITHDLSVARYISDRIAVMYQGSFVEQGETEMIFSNPQHPYTQKLLLVVEERLARWEGAVR